MAEALAVQKAVLVLQERILLDKIDCTSVYKLLSETWAIVSANAHLDDAAQRRVFKQALARVGAGSDGVPGTADDLIAPDLVKKLCALIDNGMLDDVLDIVGEPAQAACGCLAWLKGKAGKTAPA